ncbi:MAG TPA: NAD(P)H-binding protein, partial [Baekduia sp.]|nr:NAD(P)H-binding protein [Baekduia sp.]
MLLLVGPTGTIGRPLTQLLAAAGVPARGLVRDARKADGLARRGITPVLGAVEDAAALRAALDGVQRVFLLTPPGAQAMLDQQRTVVDAARAAGVAHIVKLSSIGADEAPTGARIIDAHRAVERHIERSGMAWTFLRPHWFMDNELGQAPSIAQAGVLHAPD